MTMLRDQAKVFGLGLSKTGTVSLASALKILGVRTVHFPHDERTFDELKRGEYRLSILGEYQGAVDTPIAPYFAQLDRAWPGSKFILTTREKASWLRSAEAHWHELKTGRRARDEPYQAFVDFISASVYGCIYFNAERFSYAYDRHVASVLEYFADRPDDLLVLDICGGDGWEDLCSFLGLPIPAGTAFPHAHRTSARRVVRPDVAEPDGTEYDLATVVPRDALLAVLDEEALRAHLAATRRVLPFPERDGEYWGLPADGVSAVRELERVRTEGGAEFLAVVDSSFWCLDHYSEFAAHLNARYPRVLITERVAVYDIR